MVSRAGSIALVLLAAAAPVGAQKEAHAEVAPAPGVPRGKVLQWTSPQGKPYWYRVPDKLDAKRPPNLILMLHGTGLRWGWAFWNYPIAAGRFRPDDVVVAPEGMTPGQGDTFNFVQNKEDAEQIADLIRLFRKQLPIGRVYLYGHSQGAFFCYWFAGQHPELVDGIVAHAGNVLGNVKHPPLARDKVAIGILHGRADAVVPVDCAFATEEVYRKQGYKKIKLYVVDGLTERSGHWPLPVQVGEMLEWLDQVSVASADGAVRAVIALIAKNKPDLAAVADAIERARSLLKKYRGADAAALKQQSAVVADFLGWCEEQHADALSQHPAMQDNKAPYGPWAVHFRIAHAVLSGQSSWKKAMKPQAARADKHEKQLQRALKKLRKPNAKAFAAAVKAFEQGFLGASYGELQQAIENLAGTPPRGVKPSQVVAFRDLVKTRTESEQQGQEAAAEQTAKAAERFRAGHAELFEKAGK